MLRATCRNGHAALGVGLDQHQLAGEQRRPQPGARQRVRLLDDDADQDRRPGVAGQPAAQPEQRRRGEGHRDREHQREERHAHTLSADGFQRRDHGSAGPRHVGADDVNAREIDEDRRADGPAKQDRAGRRQAQRRGRRGAEHRAGGAGGGSAEDPDDRPDDQRDAEQRSVAADAVCREAGSAALGIDRAFALAVRARRAAQRADEAAGQERVEEHGERRAGQRRLDDRPEPERRLAQQLGERRRVGRSEQARAIDGVAQRATPPRPGRRHDGDRDERDDRPGGDDGEPAARPQTRPALSDHRGRRQPGAALREAPPTSQNDSHARTCCTVSSQRDVIATGAR